MNTTNRRRALKAAAALTLAAASTGAQAQSSGYPNKPITLVIPAGTGGATDIVGRVMAEEMTKRLGVQVVVDNKTGGSGMIGTQAVARAAPDGYTLLLSHTDPDPPARHQAHRELRPDPRLHADRACLALADGARRHRQTSGPDVEGARRLRQGKAGRDPFRLVRDRWPAAQGSAPAMQDLIGGSIEMTVDTLGSLWPQHQAGRLRIVGVATAARVPTAPEVPTVAESAGFDRPFEAMLWNVVTAPRDTPTPVLKTLVDATQRAMTDAGLLARLTPQAMFAQVHLGAAGAAYVRAEREKWKPIVATLGDLSIG